MATAMPSKRRKDRGQQRGRSVDPNALADIRICGESSRFGAPIKNLGLVMAYPEMEPLVRLVGASNALAILLEGRIFDAAEAKAKRIVTRVVPDAEVGAEARDLRQKGAGAVEEVDPAEADRGLRFGVGAPQGGVLGHQA